VSEAGGQAPAYSAIDSFVPNVAAPGALLTSTMIHIGFGDSHLITMPTTGKHFLIDSGGRNADQSVVSYLQSHNVMSLDAMLATHVHEDHLGGVVGSSAPGDDGVLGVFAPPVFFDSPVKSSDSNGKPAYIELLNSLPSATQRVVISRGESSVNVPALRLDPEVNIFVLNSGVPPGYVPVGYEGTNINNESIVLRFTYGDVDFIIGGDCEREAEALIAAGFPASALDVEYFKATHHGLPDASSALYVNLLRPRVGFIPNTRAVWDPPQDFEGAIGSTVATLQGIGAHVYVIDQASTLGRLRASGRQYNVSFVTDGRSYEVRVEQATQPTPSLTAQASGCWQHIDHAHAPGAGQ
jgi:beta-lactamase superfamily II metal-dependent hydrolase